MERGYLRFDQHDLAAAEQDSRKAIALDPENAAAYNTLGLILRQKNQIEEALAAFGEAIRVSPQYFKAHLNRGETRYRQGDQAGALADFEKAIEIAPKEAWGYNDRGWARRTQGDFDGAIADFKKALELDPDFKKARANLDEALATKPATRQE
jgi:tetratricopeptide (TPR) repeat protein